MAAPYAFVTLITSDSYLPGALALVAALKDLHPSPPTAPEADFQTVCLVTPETVDVTSIKLLRGAFNVVIGVEIIEQEDERNLRLLGRLDLGTVLTKLHIFRLTQYSKIIFLDADVLPIRPMSHLFNLQHEFSAVPDVGWPDIFNSGVLVVSPGTDKFDELMQLQKSKGSWDGGDQGLLNEWRGSDWNRLSFVYNTTPTAAYTYAPAYERFGSGIAAIHFIGTEKPWKGLLYRSPGIRSSEATLGDGTKRVYNYEALVDRWYDVYDRHYRQEPTIPAHEFSIPTYSSAWDDGTSIGADFPAVGYMPVSGSGLALGLDDLRKAAVEGLSTISRSSSESLSSSSSYGDYISMPLEGRVDLMRPRKAPDPEPQTADAPSEQQEAASRTSGDSHTHRQASTDVGYFTSQIPPTPGPNEVPNAPYIHAHSLPPTATPTPYYGPSSASGSVQRSGQFNNSLQVFYRPQTQSEPGPEYDSASHPRREQLHAQSPQHQHLQSPPQQHRFVLSTPQQPQPQDSSDSDTPKPAFWYPSHFPRPHQPVPYDEQHHTHSPREQQHQGQHQQRSPGEQRIEQWTKGQRQRRGSHQAFDRPHIQARRDSYGQQQRPGGDITPSRQHYFDPRGSSPLPSGQNTPTQGNYAVNHAVRPEGQRSHESQRSRSHSHQPQGQLHVHFRQDAGQQPVRQHYEPERHQPHQVPHAPLPRPGSPPKLKWNPAVEPPPKESPPISAFPEDTYFPNVWDQPPNLEQDATYQSSPSPDRHSRADVFFYPPPAPTIPEQLIREGQYSNVLGPVGHTTDQEGALSPPVPDKNKVHAVFPWEEKPRHVPRRVFPRTDSPVPAANYIESERTSSPVSTPPAPTPVAVHAVSQVPSSPVQGIPWGVSFSNAWDTVPSIQKYASKLAGSPNIYPHLFMAPPPPAQDGDWRIQWREQREKDWQDRQDASSMDGDDEDEGESDEEEERQSESTQKGRGPSRRRGSTSKSRKQYRTRGVQATPETDAKEVQVEIIKADESTRRVSVAVGGETALAELAVTPDSPTSVAPSAASAPQATQALNRVALGYRRQWQQGSPFAPGSTLLPSAVPRDFKHEPEQVAGTPAVNTSARSGMPFPSMASPTGLRSPATLASPKTYSPPRVPSPHGIGSPAKTSSPPRVSSPLASPSAKAPTPLKTQTPKGPSPVAHLPRGNVSFHPSTSPQTGLTRTTGSPRPPGTPRRVSMSSVPGSSRAHSPVVAMNKMQFSQSTPSPKHARLSSLTSPFAPGMQRMASTDSYVTPSPSTTNDSIATPGDTPVEARQRRGSRVWDPARGVDVFKRGSEEVLSRFLRMGSFDSEEGRQKHQHHRHQSQA